MNILDIISNVRDELERAFELLKDDECAEKSMLLQDIEYSLDRLSDIDKRIEFALILAVYTAYINAQNDYEYDCDSEDWRARYIKSASDIEFEYNEDGLVSSEWAYNKADEIAKALYAE